MARRVTKTKLEDSDEQLKAALAGDPAALKAVLQKQEAKQREKLEAFLIAYNELCAEHGCRMAFECTVVDVGGGKMQVQSNYFPILEGQ
jgi:hypothetical protein